MQMNYLRGFPDEIKIINKATSNIVANLKKACIPLTPKNILEVFSSQTARNTELAIAVENYENRLGKEDELLEVKRMARETILSLFHLLQLPNMEDLESILAEIDKAKEHITIISLFGTAAFFIAEFSKSSQLKDNSAGTQKMSSSVKQMMEENKEDIRYGIENKAIDEKAGGKILSSITKSQATIEDHSMKMEDQVRMKDKELSLLLKRMEKTERMFSELKKHHLDMVKRIDDITSETRTDMLTGMLNYKGFREAQEREISRFKRYKTDLSLVMIHMDNFMEITDQFGSPVRDKLLVELSNHVKDITRKGDICGRVGAQVISVLFTNTKLEDSIVAVTKLYKNLEDTDFTVRGNSIPVVLSIGVNQCLPDDTPETLTESVDALLFKAKSMEGIRICHPEGRGEG